MAKQSWWARVKALTAREAPTVAVFFPPLPPDRRECPRCKREVAIWRTYADGAIRCVGCGQKEGR